VFPNATNTGPIETHNYMNRVFAPAIESAKIDNFHWHDLRHHADIRIMPTRFLLGLELTTDSDRSVFQKSA